MSGLAAALITLFSIIAMELFAIAFHKYVMHGSGWSWHESHHVHTEGYFEKNDLYAVWFSAIAAALFVAGSLWWTPLWYIALGFTVYGVLYGIVHDGLVHQRWPLRWSPPNKGVVRAYLHRLVLAHRLHHHVTTKDGAVSFGFLWAPPIDALKTQLKQ